MCKDDWMDDLIFARGVDYPEFYEDIEYTIPEDEKNG